MRSLPSEAVRRQGCGVPKGLVTKIRDGLPMRHQVPIKYWYCWARRRLEAEMAYLPLIVKPNDRVVDVGANRGIYTYALMRRGARVEAFEPNITCCRLLEAWARKKRQITVHAVALSNCTVTATLHIPVDGAGVEHDASASLESVWAGHCNDRQVPVTTLDSYRFDRVSLIKIDVEGHEACVVDGATTTIGTWKPALIIEIEQRHVSRPIDEVFEKILRHGYRGFFVKSHRLIPLEQFDLSVHQSHFGTLAEAYINNFVFLHKDRLDAGEYSSVSTGGSGT